MTRTQLINLLKKEKIYDYDLKPSKIKEIGKFVTVLDKARISIDFLLLHLLSPQP